jgi:hypothetical protein
VIVLSVERQEDGATIVTAPPITHSAPTRPGGAVEIPTPVKRHLGLDDQRSWVIVAEGNEFLWPRYDLRKVPHKDRYDYGFLPPGFFDQILKPFLGDGRVPTGPRSVSAPLRPSGPWRLVSAGRRSLARAARALHEAAGVAGEDLRQEGKGARRPPRSRLFATMAGPMAEAIALRRCEGRP